MFTIKKNKITIFIFLIIFLFLLSYIFFKIKHINTKINYNYDNFIIKKISKNRERYIVKNFLNEEDINFLIKLNDDYGVANRSPNIECDNNDIMDKQKKQKFRDIENKIVDMINYISKRNDILDYNITARTSKKGVSIHSDNSQKKNGKWVPNHTSHRTWTSGLLLSDKKKFKGGDFKFHSPYQIVDFNRGDLLVFKSDHSNIHEVSRIEGKRYVQLTWVKENNINNIYNKIMNLFNKN